VKWQSRDRAYQACKVITKLIEKKRDRQERDGGADYYQENKIS
jgi:hypothetical protein